ncbi:hypothetical protein AJ80_01205 [Polytolypa hystricis UAMH7299]|uniref:Uncharacterized protein n=1 Tax=Polytolypa hystricis (strain UAMH7299) TaxID=1447883 RepID=A0A2B7Z0S2_POLH7|nr:hypothetical protein AJ80_01205 [Polytolypa hystricis UAMH7299]
MPLPYLNEDVQYVVLTQLSLLDFDDESHWADAVNCMLVCRSWHNTLKRLLDRNVSSVVLLEYAPDNIALKHIQHLIAEAPEDPGTQHSLDKDGKVVTYSDMMTLYLRAVVFGGVIECIKPILEYGINPYMTFDPDGSTLMHIAVDTRNMRLLKLLLLYDDFDLDDIDDHDHTPLGLAAYLLDIEIMVLLLEFGANPNIEVGLWGEEKFPLLHFAISRNEKAMFDMLMEHVVGSWDLDLEVRMGWLTPVNRAIMEEKHDMVRLLLGNGATLSNHFAGSLCTSCTCPSYAMGKLLRDHRRKVDIMSDAYAAQFASFNRPSSLPVSPNLLDGLLDVGFVPVLGMLANDGNNDVFAAAPGEDLLGDIPMKTAEELGEIPAEMLELLEDGVL